jgi:D-glycero-alpha-D-manno-heptose 1-phosphate guanylyltransferase
MEAIILAGGLGTRLRTAVPDLPKPMAPVASRPFLEHQMDYWIDQGVRRFVLSIGYKAELIQAHFGRRYRDADIAYSIEPVPLGTGGGLLLALNQIESPAPFLILNGDTFFEVKISELRAFHEAHGSQLTIALREVQDNTRYGSVLLESGGRITGFNAIPAGGRCIMNGGIYLAEKPVFSGLGIAPGTVASLEADLFGAMLQKGRQMWGMIAPGRFIDIGIPDDYYRAAEVILQK